MSRVQDLIDSSVNPKTLKQVIALYYCFQTISVEPIYFQYHSCWSQFDSFCQTKGVLALESTPSIAMDYLLDVSDHSGVSRVYTHLSAISHYHRRAGLSSPCDSTQVKMFMKDTIYLE